MPFDLPVEVSGFPPTGPLANRSRIEQFSTSDILRAAVVSGYAMTGSKVDWRIRAWRLAAIRLALDLPPAVLPIINPRLSHPRAWRSLERSEKASINNLLGTTVAKLLCERLLNAPRLWFLDLYAGRFKAKCDGSLRPDFFTQTLKGDWHSVEAKGRSYGPSTGRLRAAKDQARALTLVNGSATKAHIVCWTKERRGCVAAVFHDPTPGGAHEISLAVELNQLVLDYYGPVLELMQVSEPIQYPGDLMLYRFAAGDFTVGLHPRAQQLVFGNGTFAARGQHEILTLGAEAFQPIGEVHAGPDGIIVIPGPSWPV